MPFAMKCPDCFDEVEFSSLDSINNHVRLHREEALHGLIISQCKSDSIVEIDEYKKFLAAMKAMSFELQEKLLVQLCGLPGYHVNVN